MGRYNQKNMSTEGKHLSNTVLYSSQRRSTNAPHTTARKETQTGRWKQGLCPLTQRVIKDGKLLSPGSSVAENEAMAKEKDVIAMLERANEGSVEAMYSLGNWYYRGEKNLPQSFDDAHWWWLRARDHL